MAVAYIALALAAFACCAGLILAWKARSRMGWRLPYRLAVLGQLVIGVASLAAALAVSLAVSLLALADEEVVVALGLAVFLLAWRTGLAALVPRLAVRAEGEVLIPFRLRRLESSVFFTVLLLGGAIGLAAAGLLRLDLASPPRGDAAGLARAPAHAPAGKSPTVAETTPGATPGVAPVEVPPPAAAAGDEAAAVIAAVQDWAAAWAARDIDRYLEHYAREFRPSNGQTREQWEAMRRRRIGGTGRISVGIESPKVTFSSGHRRAVVRFRQHYESDILTEASAKTMVMVHGVGRWRIIEERAAPE